MKELTKKVVILNNFSSPYVSQAIIILKDYNPKLESRAIADAETIVSRYIERIQKNGQPTKAVRSKSKILKRLRQYVLQSNIFLKLFEIAVHIVNIFSIFLSC